MRVVRSTSANGIALNSSAPSTKRSGCLLIRSTTTLIAIDSQRPSPASQYYLAQTTAGSNAQRVKTPQTCSKVERKRVTNSGLVLFANRVVGRNVTRRRLDTVLEDGVTATIAVTPEATRIRAGFGFVQLGYDTGDDVL